MRLFMTIYPPSPILMLYGAIEETTAPIKTITIEQAKTLFSKPLSAIWNCTYELDQNEFIEGEGSMYCTAYGMFHTYSHRFWKHPIKEIRKEFIDICLSEWIITDKWAKPWDVAMRWVKYMNDNCIFCKLYVFESNSRARAFAQMYGKHGMMTWFIVNDEFKKDRADNYILDWKVHGWAKYGGHVIFEYRVNPSTLMLRNNYPKKKANNILVKEQKKWYNPTYHLKYSYLVVYSDK